MEKQRAISIKGEKNHPYSYAIFVLKDKENPVIDFVEEAEKIINAKSAKKAEIIQEEGIKKIIIKESNAYTTLLYTSLFIMSISFLGWVSFTIL